MSSVRLALAACLRDPAVWLLNLDTGESVPVPTPLDNGGAFDHGLECRGWVAAQVEYQVMVRDMKSRLVAVAEWPGGAAATTSTA